MEKVPGTEPHILSLSKDEGRRAKTAALYLAAAGLCACSRHWLATPGNITRTTWPLSGKSSLICGKTFSFASQNSSSSV